MKLLKKVLILILLFCTTFVAWAGEAVTFNVEAPMFVTMGEAFRVSFNLNAKPDNDTFKAPSFENFDVLAGPTVSQGSSVQIVNGSVSKSVNYAMTFVLLPQKKGAFTIGAATITVDGKSYSSKSTPIEVRAAGQSSNQTESAENQAARRIEKDDLILQLSLSSKSVYKGEAVRAKLRLYSRVHIGNWEVTKIPEFTGFWKQQLQVQQGPFRETYNGKIYEVYNLAEYLLYPQQDGNITIDPVEMKVLARIVLQRQSNDPFDAFFGGGHEAYSVQRVLKTSPITVRIKPFPAEAPASFTGAVGSYKMTHELSASEVQANSAVTLRVKISGSGNINFVSAPKLSLPATFEAYDVKSEEKIQNTPSGSSGYRSFEYPFIVRAEGDYEVEPVEFTYFNLDKGKYETLSTGPLTIKVTPDKNAAVATPQVQTPVTVKREDVQQLSEDIRFIKLGNPALHKVVAPLVLSPLYWGVVVAMLLLAIIIYAIVRKYIRDNSDVVLVKGKRANRVAVKRFRVAERYMKEQDRRGFYEEMLRAMWGYLSDRFNIPVADLTREVVREELGRRQASAEAESIIAVIARCEEAQYSPQTSVEMHDVYDAGVEAVSKIEKIAK